MRSSQVLAIPLVALALAPAIAIASGDHDHEHGHENPGAMIERMREAHAGHDHAHDFEALEEMSDEDMMRTMNVLRDVGLAMPEMDSHRGAELFMNKGCIICHSVNGVGGEVGPSLNATDMPDVMNAFEFAARMWRGAPAMAELQEEVLGEIIELDGQDLADLVAFVHDEHAQAEVSQEDIPHEFRELLNN